MAADTCVCPTRIVGCVSLAHVVVHVVVLQGVCTTEDCPYAHVKVDPHAPVCQEFVSGHCPRGVACTKKHLTPRMIRQLRQSKALQASRVWQCFSAPRGATVSSGWPELGYAGSVLYVVQF